MRSELTRIGPVLLAALCLNLTTAAPGWASPFGGEQVGPANSTGGTTPSTTSGLSANTGRSSTQFMLVLDPEQSAADINQRLAAAGFGKMEWIPGVPPRLGKYRLLDVAAANAQTKAALLGIEGITAVRPVYPGGVDGSPVLSTGEVIVGFKSDGTDVNGLASRHGCRVTDRFQGINRTYVWSLVDESSTDAFKVAEQVAKESGVLYTQPNLLMKIEKHQVADEIADPYYHFQWHLNNTGQWEGAVPDADIDAPEAWTLTLGEGAIVGLIDDSVQPDHEDIADNYLTGWDFFDMDADPSPAFGPVFYSPYYDDPIGDAHGVATSGIICARDNNVGVRGVAPEAQLVGIRLGGLFGMLWATTVDLANAFLFCEQNGAMAINNSYGLPGYPYYLYVFNSEWMPLGVVGEAIDYVATQGRDGLGVLVLFSAGNESMDIRNGNIYAAHDRAMAIGATLRDDRLSCYSNFGPNQSIVAPGGGAYWISGCFEADITTTDVTEIPDPLPYFYYYYYDDNGDIIYVTPFTAYPLNGYNPRMKWYYTDYDLYYSEELGWYNDAQLVRDQSFSDLPNYNYTRQFNGTSAACPVATGVAALVFSVNPGYTAYEVRNIMEHTADQVLTEGAYDGVTGQNKYMGHGRGNAYAAVTAASNYESWPNPVDHLGAEQLANTVHINWDLPDWSKDGQADEDAVGVLVVQGKRGQLGWHPTDGEVYIVGQEVASETFVVANEYITSYVAEGLPSANYDYAVFVRNDNDYYSWGRRVPLDGEPTEEEPDQPVRASIVATPRTGAAPLTVRFTGGGVDPEGGQFLLFNWDFGDGGQGTGPLIDHTYSSAGTYMVRLSATTSSAGTAKASAQIVVTSAGNEAPSVRIVATPDSGSAPLIVLFEADASDFDGVVVRYEWDFGDGETATGAVTEHVYLDAGLYVVMLTVIDNLGGKTQSTALLRVTSGEGATAGAVTPESALDSRGLLFGNCGAGASGATLTSLALMLGGVTLRRRRP